MIELKCARYAKDGTPIMTDSQISKYAEELVRDYKVKYIDEPWELDAERFVEFYLKANLDFVDIYCNEGEHIAGATIFAEETIKLFDRDRLCTRLETFAAGTILIDNETEEKGSKEFKRFTVLHEAGHWCLHQNVFAEGVSQNNQGGTKKAICCRKEGFMRRKARLETQEEFREHQANVFAASIMMPERLFKEVAIDYIHRMGCEEDYYVRPTLKETDYDDCAEHLAYHMGRKFGVSKSAAMTQLRKLGLIKTHYEDYLERRNAHRA